MAYRKDDRAISQILGTMLVIGIAVILAIVVGIMLHQVTQEQGRGDPPPSLGAVQPDDDPEVRIIKVPADMPLRWGEEIRTEGTCDPLLNGQPFAASLGQPLEVDDRLSCDPGETLHIVHQGSDSGAVLYRFRFD